MLTSSESEAREWLAWHGEPWAGPLMSLAIPEPYVDHLLNELTVNAAEQPDLAWLWNRAAAHLRASRPPLPGAILGWDVGAIDDVDIHSWLCNGMGREVSKRAGVAPDARGLFSSLGDAQLIASTADLVTGDQNDEYSSWTPFGLIVHAGGGGATT